jgi:hypothetical protein
VHGGTFDASRRILTGLRPASAVCSFFAHAIAGRYGRWLAPAARAAATHRFGVSRYRPACEGGTARTYGFGFWASASEGHAID